MGYGAFSISAVVLSLVLGFQAGCSTVKKKVEDSRRVELVSDPAGAEVLSVTGEKLGFTPLVLEEELLRKNMKNGQLDLVLSAPGFVQREVLLKVHGKDTHLVQLQPYEQNFFSERLLHDFSTQANAMARGLVEIQSMVFARKLSEAERALETYQRSFPNIAASYVLSASVESLRGNNDKAKRYLLRARSLDPLDPVAARMLAKPGTATASRPSTGVTAAPPVASTTPSTTAPVPAPKSQPSRRAPASAPAKAKATAPATAPVTAPAPAGGGQ